jgi:hypothetical protein
MKVKEEQEKAKASIVAKAIDRIMKEQVITKNDCSTQNFLDKMSHNSIFCLLL